MNYLKKTKEFSLEGDVYQYGDLLYAIYRLSPLTIDRYTLFLNEKTGMTLNVWTPSDKVWNFEEYEKFDTSNIKACLLDKKESGAMSLNNNRNNSEEFLANIQSVVDKMFKNNNIETIKKVLQQNNYNELEFIGIDDINSVYLYKASRNRSYDLYLNVIARNDCLVVLEREYTGNGVQKNIVEISL
ncbi:hypothetical protein [Priestia aryabhattai]